MVSFGNMQVDKKYTQYAEDVLNDKIVAGEYIKLACKRYLSWFERDDIYFDSDAVDRVVNFISKLKHYTGSHNNKPFILSDWQFWIVCSIYGFKRKKDDTRVIRSVYIEVARKNGKTALVSALCLYHLIADKEPNASVILAANSAKQAGLCFSMASTFLGGIDPKNKYFKRFRDTIKFDMTKSQLHIVAADASKLDGLNASMFVCDELHEAPNGNVFNVLETSTGMRTQPLSVCITTSGFNRSSFCYEMRSTYIDILLGTKQEDSSFCAIYTPDKDDDPFTEDRNVMLKANPNLDVTIKSEYLIDQLRKAKNNPTLQTSVLTKLFNQWLSTSEEWINSKYIVAAQQKWEYEDFGNDGIAYLGVDLASTNDLTCISVMIPLDSKYYFRNYYFIPQEQLETPNPNMELYRMWQQQDDLIVTPGNCTDYDYILNKIMEINEKVTIAQVSYDKWNSTQWAISATEQGLNLQPYSMSIGSLNRPTKEIARQILSENVVIYPNKIDNFCFDNSVVKRDWNDNEKIIKENNMNKIDGVIAMIMALGGYLTSNHFDNSVFGLDFTEN